VQRACAVRHTAAADANDLAALLRRFDYGTTEDLGELVGGALRLLCDSDECRMASAAAGIVTGLAQKGMSLSLGGGALHGARALPPTESLSTASSLIELFNSPPKKRKACSTEQQDAEAAALLLSNIKKFVQGPLATYGTRPANLQLKADILTVVLHSRELDEEQRLLSAAYGRPSWSARWSGRGYTGGLYIHSYNCTISGLDDDELNINPPTPCQ